MVKRFVLVNIFDIRMFYLVPIVHLLDKGPESRKKGKEKGKEGKEREKNERRKERKKERKGNILEPLLLREGKEQNLHLILSFVLILNIQ